MRGEAAVKQAAKRVSAKVAGAVPPPLRQAFDANALHVWGFAAPSIGAVDLALVRRAIRDEEKLDLSYRDEMGRVDGMPVPPGDGLMFFGGASPIAMSTHVCFRPKRWRACIAGASGERTDRRSFCCEVALPRASRCAPAALRDRTACGPPPT